MTHVEEERVTTTYETEDPPTPQVKKVTLVNKEGDTVTVDETPAETSTTRTTTTRTEVDQPD
jgi:hypothetical protein